MYQSRLHTCMQTASQGKTVYMAVSSKGLRMTTLELRMNACVVMHIYMVRTQPTTWNLLAWYLASYPGSIISQVCLDNFSPCTCSRCSHSSSPHSSSPHSCYIILLIQASLVAVLTPHVCGVKLYYSMSVHGVWLHYYKVNRHTYVQQIYTIHIYIQVRIYI